MAEIKTKDNKYIVLVDDNLFEELNKFKWYSKLDFRSKKPYIRRRTKSKDIYIHRQIMSVSNSKIQVDHINMNTLDNRKENLRICERGAQNAINRPKQKNNRSGYKGVYFNKKSNNFCAQIRFNQQTIRLGYFETAEEAAKTYNHAAIEYFKEFAYLNKIEKKD